MLPWNVGQLMCWMRWPSRERPRWMALPLHCALFQIHKQSCHRGLRAVNVYHTLRLVGRSRCFPQHWHLTSHLHRAEGGQVTVKFTAVISWCNWLRIMMSTVKSGDRQVMKYAKQTRLRCMGLFAASRRTAMWPAGLYREQTSQRENEKKPAYV